MHSNTTGSKQHSMASCSRLPRIQIKPRDKRKTAFRTRYGTSRTPCHAIHQAYERPRRVPISRQSADAPTTGGQHLYRLSRCYSHLFRKLGKNTRLQSASLPTDHRERIIRVPGLLSVSFINIKWNSSDSLLTKMDPKRVQTIQEWKDHSPNSHHDIQVFLGVCNLYHRFIRRYAETHALSRAFSKAVKTEQNRQL